VTLADLGANTKTLLDDQLSADTAYSYQVSRYFGAGNFSDYSQCASATTAVAGTPQAPSALRAYAGSNRVSLHWDDASDNETAFEIYRQAGSGGWALLDTVPANTQSYTDATAAGNNAATSYQYDVRACNASGCSMPAPGMAVPFKPSNLAATANSVVHLAWQDNSGNETGFNIERKNGRCGSSNPWVEAGAVAADIQAYDDSGAVPGTVYAYRVRAYYGTGVLLQGFPAFQAYGYSGFTGCVSAKAP